MGAAAACNVLKAGFPLIVHDLKRSAGAHLLELGAKWAESPAACAAAADVVVTMVPGPREIEAVIRGKNGLRAGARNGLTWVDMTTNRPALLRSLAAELAPLGVETVDAPVTGAVDGAIGGYLIFFAGGPRGSVKRVRPVLEAMGKVLYVGELGAGSIVKLVTNQLWFIHAAAVGESLAIARKAGIDLKMLWEAMKAGAADSFVCRHDIPSIFAGHYDPSFSLDLCCKDLALISELSDEYKIPADITHLTATKFERARQAYGGGAGELHVCKLIEDAAGISLRVAGDWPKHWEAL
jgi:3-hydroxyisobutyrate dehydrogenase